MVDICWKNVKENLCVICKISLGSSSYYICNKCQKVCEVVYTKISRQIMDVKSICCNANIESHQKITCGDYCHEKFIVKMMCEHGVYKKVTDQQSGISYKVPTRIIIEEGITYQDLKRYPPWD